jgi:dCTP deaminase
MLKPLKDVNGVLPSQYLQEVIRLGLLHAGEFAVPPENVQPASLDLRLGEEAYRLRCSFLPGNASVEERCQSQRLVLDKLDLRKAGAILEPGRPYLIPLKEELALPRFMQAKANPKSSTGRVDVFTRVVTDHSPRFDEIRSGYEGRLYLEVVPLSFAVRVQEDLSLNQLRLSVGRAAVSDAELRRIHKKRPVLFQQGVAVKALPLGNGLYLGLDLRGHDHGPIGYRAKPHTPLLDLTSNTPEPPDLYWDRVSPEDDGRIVLDPRQFYLLMSNEAVCIPPEYAAEMTAYDPTNGELRTHYAGFFDPGFGYDPSGLFEGSRAALEVRAHDVPFMIDHGQPVCKLTFERLIEPPDDLYGDAMRSSYQEQQDALSKYFERPLPPGHPVRPPQGIPQTSQDRLPFEAL